METFIKIFLWWNIMFGIINFASVLLLDDTIERINCFLSWFTNLTIIVIISYLM